MKILFKPLIAIFASIALVLVVVGLMAISQPIAAQGGVTTYANLEATNFYRAQPRTAIVVTMNGWVTPTGTYQRISAAGTVATSGAKIAVKPRGTILILLNSGSNTITFTETGTLVSAGNIVLGANDSATLLSNGTNWYQIAASNN